jgi:hypothetical protein
MLDTPRANLFQQVFLVSRRFQSVAIGGQRAKLRIAVNYALIFIFGQ